MLKVGLLSLASAVVMTATFAPSEAEAYDGYVSGAYVGATVQVYSGGGWADATILDIQGSSVLVRYLDGSWGDEWVDVTQLSVGAAVPVYQPPIQVYYGNQWYDGTLLATRGGRYHVHYHGRSEWIGSDRFRHRGGRAYVAPRSHRGHHHGWHGGHGRRDNDRGWRGGHGRRDNDRGWNNGGHGRRDNDRGWRGGNGRRDNDRGWNNGGRRDRDRGDHGRGRGRGGRGR